MKYTSFTLLLLAVFSFYQSLNAQTEAPYQSVTKHSINIQGKATAYTATAGFIVTRKDNGDEFARIWTTTYTLDGVQDATARPVMFVFNGGPGSASVWLHLGLLGPKLVKVAGSADADDGAPPYPIIDNPVCLLDLVDLVFIDPVGTGYSVTGKDSDPKEHWGLMEDAESVAALIREWVRKNKRWNAPKFICGESFGTTRAAAIADVLHGGGQDMALNGLVMISQALDYTGSTPDPNNLIAHLTYLPTMAATAWYHGKAGQGQTLPAFVEECRQFVYDEYAPALLRGSTLSADQMQKVARRMAYFMGLDENYILRSHLRVLAPRFRKELLRNDDKTVGNLDSRYTLREYDQMADSPTHDDAASNAITSAYTTAMYTYLTKDLQVDWEGTYYTGGNLSSWNWRPGPEGGYWEPSYVNTAPMLSSAMMNNQDLKVMVASGYYDLVTPFFDAEYTFHRHGIPMDRVDMRYYEGGHMMYVNPTELTALANDIRAFLTAALAQ